MSQMLANRFTILSELGRGGMGTVYRVADTLRGDLEVALKTIQMQGSITPELQLRFKEEFRSMVKLKHPNTIEVFDYGQIDEQTQYITMEIVPGSELGELISEQLPLQKTYELLIQLLQALGFIHSRYYVHRDIKAENIRIKEDGTLKLMDFGLMDQLGNPSSGKITGTPGYLPPEVAKGGIINASSDLYSVGCLAYEMITGRLPFQGSMIEVIRAHINQDPVPLGQVRPDVPERLEKIVMRLLDKDQQTRYQQASEVIEDLSDLAGISVTRVNLDQKKSYLTSSVLVGRDKELKQLEDALETVRNGKGSSVFVGAPAGIGKSRLVHELTLQAQLNDVPVLHGQCLESGMSAYEPLVQALRPVLAMSTPDEIQQHAPVLLKLFPELEREGHQAAPALDVNHEKLRLNDTLVEWLQSVTARNALVLFFDDMHWCDPQSLETYNHIVRQMTGHRLLCLVTFRNDEIPPSSPIWFTIEEGVTQYLKLNAFNLPQVMLLLQAMLRDVKISKEFSEFLFNATSGNAFFLTEVMRYLMEEGVLTLKEGVWQFPSDIGTLQVPGSVEATVIRRLSQLSDEAKGLARVASVLGRYQDREMLLVVSRLEDEQLFTRIDELLERQFIVKDDQGYTFPHDRVREALYDDIPSDELKDLHLRCGEYLERLHAGNLEAITNDLAYHFSRSNDRMKAYRYLRQAGDRAMNSGIGMTTMEYWRQAEEVLATLDYPDKEVEQVDLWWNIGSFGFEVWPSVAVDALEKVVKVLEAQGNLAQICGVLKKVVGGVKKLPPAARDKILAELTKPVPYKHKIRKGLAKLVPPPPPAWVPRTLEAYTFMGAAYGFAGQPVKGLEKVRHAIDLLPFKDHPLEGAMLVASCVCLCPAGRYDEMLESARRAGTMLIDRDITGIKVAAAARVGYADHILACCFQGIRPSEKDLEYGIRASTENDTPHLFNICWSRFGVYYAWTGRYEEGMEIVERITQHSRKVGSPLHQWAIYLRPYLLYQRGEFEEAKALVQQALRYPHLEYDDCALQNVYILKGYINLALGDLDGAAEDFVAAEKRGRWGKMGLVIIQSLIAQGELAIARNDLGKAKQFLSEALKMCRDKDTHNPLHEAIVLRLRGEIALQEGDFEKAQKRFDRALAIVTRPEQDNLIEQGKLHRDRGEWHLAQGDKEAARQEFIKAGELFHGLKNRYMLRPVSQRLEELREPNATQPVQFVLPDEGRETRLSMLSTQWREQFLPSTKTIASDEQFFQNLLGTCLDSLGAVEASYFVIDPTPMWTASRTTLGASGQVKTNLAFIEQVCEEKAGLFAIDIPAELDIGVGSNLETEMPSVAVAPVLLDGKVRAVIYVTKKDISAPFEDEDLQILSGFCGMIAETLGERLVRRSVALDVRVSQLAEELRTTFLNQSMSGKSHQDIFTSLLGECASKLSLDEVSVVIGQADQPEVVASYSDIPNPAKLNPGYIEQVISSGQGMCAVDIPDELAMGSLSEVNFPSVAVLPLGNSDDKPSTLYCVRRNLEAPLTEEDLPSIAAAGKVLIEALGGLNELKTL